METACELLLETSLLASAVARAMLWAGHVTLASKDSSTYKLPTQMGVKVSQMKYRVTNYFNC